MYYLYVSSNIMSMGGLALAIGVLVEAAMATENGYRHLSERQTKSSQIGALLWERDQGWAGCAVEVSATLHCGRSVKALRTQRHGTGRVLLAGESGWGGDGGRMVGNRTVMICVRLLAYGVCAGLAAKRTAWEAETGGP